MPHTIFLRIVVVVSVAVLLWVTFFPKSSKAMRITISIICVVCIYAAMVLPPYLALRSAQDKNAQMEQKTEALIHGQYWTQEKHTLGNIKK